MIGVIINNVKSRYNTFLTKIVKAQLIYYIYKKTNITSIVFKHLSL